MVAQQLGKERRPDLSVFSFPILDNRSGPSVTLADVLAQGILDPARAKRLAWQIAAELWSAHRSGMAHGAVTAPNIVLCDSGLDERAVITTCHGVCRTTVRDDIHAFGKLLDLLLPGHRLAAECQTSNDYARPDSMELVIEELQDIGEVRSWIGGLLIAVAASAFCVFELAHPWLTR